MEFTNPNRRPLGELIKMAEKENKTIVIIGAGESGRLVERVINDPNMMAIHIVNLTSEDQSIVSNKMNKIEDNPFDNSLKMVIKNYHEPLPEIRLKRDDMNKQWYEKLSPSGKNRRKF